MKKYLSIVFIILISAVLFLGKNSFFQEKGRTVYSKLAVLWDNYKPKVETSSQNAKSFFQRNILDRITREVEKRKEIAQKELEKEKEETKKSIWQGIKDFFSNQLRKITR